MRSGARRESANARRPQFPSILGCWRPTHTRGSGAFRGSALEDLALLEFSLYTTQLPRQGFIVDPPLGHAREPRGDVENDEVLATFLVGDVEPVRRARRDRDQLVLAQVGD